MYVEGPEGLSIVWLPLAVRSVCMTEPASRDPSIHRELNQQSLNSEPTWRKMKPSKIDFFDLSSLLFSKWRKGLLGLRNGTTNDDRRIRNSPSAKGKKASLCFFDLCHVFSTFSAFKRRLFRVALGKQEAKSNRQRKKKRKKAEEKVPFPNEAKKAYSGCSRPWIIKDFAFFCFVILEEYLIRESFFFLGANSSQLRYSTRL